MHPGIGHLYIPLTSLENNNPFSIKPTVVWVKSFFKKVNISGFKYFYLFQTGKTMVPKYGYLMLSGHIRHSVYKAWVTNFFVLWKTYILF